MKLVLVASVLMATTAVPAFASESSEASAVGPQRERRICRRLDHRTQTRVSRQRVCLTPAQWRARSDAPVDDFVNTMAVRARQLESESYTGPNTSPR